MPQPASTLTATLGQFISSARYEDLPDHVLAEARIRLLDAIGSAVAGRRNITTRLGVDWAMRFAGAGASSAWFLDRTVSVQDAAFANSVFVHSILLEDAGPSGHAASTVVPSALAAAEAAGSGGLELLTAIAVGYEIQARISAGGMTARAFHGRPTGLTGTFGAAAAAAVAMKLSAVETASAIAIAASLCAPGIEQPLLEGSFERCLQIGQLTRSGVAAAQFAAAGYAGARSALDGERGFYASFCGQPAPTGLITAELGTTWLSLGNSVYKPYPTAVLNMAPVYCMEQLARSPRFRRDAISEIRVRMTWWNRSRHYLYAGPFDTVEQALMSCPFAVAATARYGTLDWRALSCAMDDPAVASLASRVSVEGVSSDSWNRYQSAEVSAVFEDGHVTTRSSSSLPPELVALTWPDAVEKFSRSTRAELAPDARRSLITVVENTGSEASVRRLCHILRSGPWT